MLPYFVWSLLFVLSCGLFQTSYCYTGVSRAFHSMGKSIVESSVVTNGTDVPRIDVKRLSDKLNDYFLVAMEPYAKPEDWSYAVDEKTFRQDRKVVVSFRCDFHLLGTYSDSLTFRVRKGL